MYLYLPFPRQVVKADIYSVDSLAGRFKGCDVVMSCLVTKVYRNVTIYSLTIKSIIDAMRKANVARFIAVTSWCTAGNANHTGLEG